MIVEGAFFVLLHRILGEFHLRRCCACTAVIAKIGRKKNWLGLERNIAG
jgi:hypothetical protein